MRENWSKASGTGLGRVGGHAHTMAAAWWIAACCTLGCGNDNAGSDAKADAFVVDSADDAVVDAVVDATVDVVSGTLKWTAATPPMDGKVLAAAPVPGAPGRYVVVGQDGGVVLVDGAKMSAVTAVGVGKNHLNAVWVDAAGTAWIGGDGSTLVFGKDADWQTVGAIPPSPPVRFRAVAGDAKSILAVGDHGQAWLRVDDGVFAPAAVSVTEGEAPAENAAFVGAAVAGDTIWILADQGTTSAGVALQKTATGWRGHPLPVAPRTMWRAANGDIWVVGGTVEAFVSRYDGKTWMVQTDLKWQLGFTAVAGHGGDDVRLGALKGQVRIWDGKSFEVVLVAPPPGTAKPFAQPSGDVAAIAMHSANEWVVATPFYLYRYGLAP